MTREGMFAAKKAYLDMVLAKFSYLPESLCFLRDLTHGDDADLTAAYAVYEKTSAEYFAPFRATP